MSLYATFLSNNTGVFSAGSTISIGTIDSQAKAANGGVIDSGQLFFQTADSTYPGLVSTGTQTFAGAKTLTGILSVNTINDVTLGDGVTISSLSGVTASGQVNIITGNSSGDSSGVINIQTGTFGGAGARGSLDIDVGALNLYSATYFNLNTAIVSGGQFEAVDGSAAAPSFHFGNDVNTGMYSVGADQLGFATNGTNRLTIENHTVTFTLTSTPSPGQILPDSDYNLDIGTSDKHLNDIWGYETFMSFYKFEDGDVGAGAIMGHIQSSTGRGIYLETLAPYRTADVTLDTEGNIFLKASAVNVEKTLYNTEHDQGNSGATKTIDLASGQLQKLTMTDDCTLTLSNPIAGAVYALKLVQDGTGDWQMTWPVTVKWPGGTAPTLSGASKIDMITLLWDGTSYYGTFGLNY